jgi:hypothetical protein
VRDNPAAFTPGNLVIYRVGNGTPGGFANTGAAVFLDEYTPAGAFVQSIALPTTASGANRPLIANGTQNTEGLLTRSGNGFYLVLTGYARDVTITELLTNSSSADVNRVVGLVDNKAKIDTTTALTDFASNNTPRGAFSPNGTDIWVAGASGGVRYTTLGATTSTQLSTTVSNLRGVGIFDGQLYTSTASGSTVV